MTCTSGHEVILYERIRRKYVIRFFQGSVYEKIDFYLTYMTYNTVTHTTLYIYITYFV